MTRRIAIVLPNLQIGGAERISITLAEELISQGFAVDLVLLQARGALLATVPAAARVIDLQAPRLRNALTALWRYFREARPAACYANIWPLTLIAAISGKVAGTQVITMHHNSLSSQYLDTRRHSPLVMKAALRLELALATKVAGCSVGVIEDLASLAGAPSRLFQAIPNPVKIRTNVDSGAVAAANDMWGVPRGRRILAVGNLKPQKNYPLLFEAYAAMTKGDADRLIVIGEGELRDALEAQVRELGIDHWVRMPGQRECPEAYYKTADLFVMSSRHEGLPTVLMEALGFGLPIVSTDCPSGPREILDGGRFGTLVAMDDALALAKAMEDALAGPADEAALTSRANDFAPDAISRRLLGLLADGTFA
ncbi:MAG TPA: glycosyltransferase [Sphingomicrobium sp.]|nr:glycosyltransferase [Sphingomicrobium sp.]